MTFFASFHFYNCNFLIKLIIVLQTVLFKGECFFQGIVAEIHSIFLVFFSVVGTQGTLQTVTLQRSLVQQSKSPVNMPITLAPSGTVSAAVPSGGHVVTNIAPAPVAAAATSKGLHSTAQTPGKN